MAVVLLLVFVVVVDVLFVDGGGRECRSGGDIVGI